MLYITGRISDRKIVETTEISSNVVIADYKAAIAKNYGGTAASYSILALEKSDPAFERIQSGAQWEAVWTGSAVTGVDFSAYDAKYRINITTSEAEIPADGSKVAEIAMQLLDASDIPLFSDINDFYLPVQSPLCTIVKKVNFTGGTARFNFSTDIAGAWRFPVNGTKMIGPYRIKNQVAVEALMV
jgi:uncharacterized protein YbjQ (UPF0145 family)